MPAFYEAPLTIQIGTPVTRPASGTQQAPEAESPGHGETVDDCEHRAAPYGHPGLRPDSPLVVSFQTPELDLQVAIGQLFSQETEQRTEQPGLFQ